MDPEETLQAARRALAKYRSAEDAGDADAAADAAWALAANFEALDGWLNRGGFPPADWAPGRQA